MYSTNFQMNSKSELRRKKITQGQENQFFNNLVNGKEYFKWLGPGKMED